MAAADTFWFNSAPANLWFIACINLRLKMPSSAVVEAPEGLHEPSEIVPLP
jgi:hypothetical protein